MTILRSYKEIWFGIGLGTLAWFVDAVMHVELGGEVHSQNLFNEIFAPHPTTFVFRIFYFAIAVAFGFFLWRMNWRERQLRAFEDVIVSFQRQMDASALKIITGIRTLQKRNSIRLDDIAAQTAAGIEADAVVLDELAKKYMEFGRLVQAGETTRAIESLHSIEDRLSEMRAAAKR